MAWQGIEGHDDIVELFRRSLQSNRLGSTFLFVGPAGIGKRMFAMKLAQSLLCDQAEQRPLDPCGACPSCAQVIAESHPDLDIITKPTDKSFIPIKLLIGDKDHRMREGLCARISLRPMAGGRKVGIIDDADHLNQEGANCLLKTLEEPPPKSVLILIGTSPQRQLPTIRSRSQIVRFQPLAIGTCTRLIQQLGWVAEGDESAARQLAEMSGGSLAAAEQWNDPDLWNFRVDLLKQLAGRDWDSLSLAKQVREFVESAGKEAPKRRARLRIVIEIVEGFYRLAMRQRVGGEIPADQDLQSCLTRFANADIAPETLADCVERTQQATTHVNANANLATVIEAWIDDISQLVLGRGIPHSIHW